MIAYILRYFGYRLARLSDDLTNRNEREAAGAMIVFLTRRWGIPPTLPTSIPTAFAEHAARFLPSVGLDARGRRKVDDV